MDGWVPAPSAILPPRIDLDAVEALPLKAPVQVTASLEGEHAIAVRQDAPPVEARAAASASERAVAAVGARLQRIFPEPEANAAPALRLTPAPEFDTAADPEPSGEPVQEAQDGPTLFDVAPQPPQPEPQPEPEPTPLPVILPIRDKPAIVVRKVHNWTGLVAPIALAVVGVVLTGAALFWGVYDGSEALGLNRRAVIWVGGLAGVSMMAFSAYLALRRLSDMEDGGA
jgi:hypothetical protein